MFRGTPLFQFVHVASFLVTEHNHWEGSGSTILYPPFRYLFLTCLTSFSSRWALAFLTAFLHAQAVSLYSLQSACSCFLIFYAFFFVFEFRQDFHFIYIGLAFLPDSLLFGMNVSWVWRRWSLSIKQLSLTPPSLQGSVPWGCLQAGPQRDQSLLSRMPGLWSCFFFLSPSYWCCECQQDHCNFRLPVTFMSLRSPPFLLSMRSSTECLIVGSSITWVRNLSVLSGSALDANSQGCCPSCRYHNGLSPPPWGPGPLIVRLLLPVCRGPYPLDFLARCLVADVHSLQCHPYWAAL